MAYQREERMAKQSKIEKLNEAAFQNPGAIGGGDVLAKQNSGETVTVACKLGVAYYDIYLCRKETVSENTQTGPRDITRFTPQRETTVRLRGTAYPRGTVPDGFPEKPLIVEGAALNPGISKEFWDTWADQNRLNPLVMNRMIFADINLDFVKGIAKETKDMQSGLEPINPKKDARIPKSTRVEISELETEESRAKKMNAIV